MKFPKKLLWVKWTILTWLWPKIMSAYVPGSILKIFSKLWEEWPSGLRRCSKNRKVPSSIPTRRSVGLRDPTLLRGSRWPSGRKCKKTQWLTSGEWGCPLDNGPKLAMGQPNSSFKNFFWPSWDLKPSKFISQDML